MTQENGKVGAPSYTTLQIFDQVLIYVPTLDNRMMNEVQPHSFESAAGLVEMKDVYYHHGKSVPVLGANGKPTMTADGRKEAHVFANDKFFVPKWALGRDIIATVEYIEKRTADGRSYTLRNIRLSEGRALCSLRIEAGGTYPIFGSNGMGYSVIEPERKANIHRRRKAAKERNQREIEDRLMAPFRQ